MSKSKLELQTSSIRDQDSWCSNKKSSATNTVLSSQSSGFNFDSPKMFQRKPSFKIFQRKPKLEKEEDNKIRFISPQKSEIFKKYVNNGQSKSDINSSFYSRNSNQKQCFQQIQKSSNENSLFLDLSQTNQILNQLNKANFQDGFTTLKNEKDDFKSIFSDKLKKKGFSKKREQQLFNLKQNKENEFLEDIDKLLKITDLCSPINSKSTRKNKQTNRKYFPKHRQENNVEKYIQQNQTLKNQVQELNEEKDSSNRKFKELQNQKNEMTESLRLFLQQIKILQNKLQKQDRDLQNYKKQNQELQSKISFSENILFNSQQQLQSLRLYKLHTEAFIKENESNQNFKQLYYSIKQNNKYLIVQNNILKKQLQESKTSQLKAQKLESINKKLKARNKMLIKQMEEMQNSQLQKNTNIFKDRKNSLKNHNEYKERKEPTLQTKFRKSTIIPNDQNHLKLSKQKIDKLRQNKYNGFRRSKQSEKGHNDQKYMIQQEECLSNISNDTQSELSFELSPEKKANQFRKQCSKTEQKWNLNGKKGEQKRFSLGNGGMHNFLYTV